jgi:poly(beta-D-mannuronate) lyase
LWLLAAGGPASCLKAGEGPTNATPVSDRDGAISGPLKSPFDVELRRKLVGTPMPEPAAGGPSVAPVRNLRGVSFYVDARHSVADPELRERNERAVGPVREYVGIVIGLADGWMRSAPADARFAALALDHLFVWASAGALLGATNRQGGYERTWTLGSLALAFLKIADAPAVDAHKLAVVRDWLSEVANEVIPEYEGANRESARNNHACWAGLAVGAAGVAANQRPLFDWGISRARLAISDVQRDGTLPLEMDRGSATAALACVGGEAARRREARGRSDACLRRTCAASPAVRTLTAACSTVSAPVSVAARASRRREALRACAGCSRPRLQNASGYLRFGQCFDSAARRPRLLPKTSGLAQPYGGVKRLTATLLTQSQH